MLALAATGAAASVVLTGTTASAQAATNHVRDVKVHASDGGGVEIEIVGTGAPSYNVRVADGGRRLVIDLSDSDVAGAPAAITTPVGVVGGVLTQGYETTVGHMTRLTVNLAQPTTYRVVPQGTNLKVLLAVTDPGLKLSKPAAGPAPEPASTPTAIVRDVRFERAPATSTGCAPYGCDRVVVDLGSIPAYSLSMSATGRPRLELRATALPETLARTLDVSAFGGALKTVTASRDAAAGTAILELDRLAEVPGTVSVEGGALIWSFPVPKASSQPSPIAQLHIDGRAVGKDGGAVRRVVTVAREKEMADLPRIETSIHDEDPVVETAGGGAAGFASAAGNSVLGQARYTGRRINIDLKDADIHNVLRLLADTGHVNVVTADDVGGTITIRMVNVPWDQVLDVVLQAKGLGMVRTGNLIRVAKLDQLQKERELKLAAMKQEYELTPLETRLIPISYATADELQQRAKELLSPRGSIAVDERTNVLIARDIGANLNYIEELIRSLDTQTAEVLIEARIVEATSKYQRDVGIQWGGDSTFSAATGNPTGVAFPSSVGVTGGNYDNNTPTAGLSPFTRNVPTPNFAVNLPAAVGTGSGGALGVTLGSIDNTLNLALRLSALESSGLVRIVSSPKIMVLDNKEARINQGTLIPFAQVSALGVQTTFQEAKLQLLVRPHVTADGGVAMHIKLNRDEPDFTQTSPRGDPTILKREAETDLLIIDGHTAVIGGIYTRNTGRNLDQIPFFGDIPIIGVLFQRRRAADARGELLIFITPHIVNRSESLGR
ncbi:MAG: type IV pilus secretin PilQ [Polyangiaceae bacterium]|jgi:type IV pilus assembly protein PilQ